MNKNRKLKVIRIILCLLTICALVGFSACMKDNDNKIPRYDTFESHLGDIFIEHAFLIHRVGELVITSVEQLETFISTEPLEMYEWSCDKYTDEYFQSNVVILIEFLYSSSEKDIVFKDLAIKGEKIYPVFELNGVLPGGKSCDDVCTNLYSIECSKEIIDYQIEEAIAINNNDLYGGSIHHDSIMDIFK